MGVKSSSTGISVVADFHQDDVNTLKYPGVCQSAQRLPEL